MGINDLLILTETAERAAKAINSNVPPAFNLKYAKTPKGSRVKITEGLYGEVLQHGNARFPSVIRVLCSDVRKLESRLLDEQ